MVFADKITTSIRLFIAHGSQDMFIVSNKRAEKIVVRSSYDMLTESNKQSEKLIFKQFISYLNWAINGLKSIVTVSNKRFEKSR